ncbi:MAG: FecR family protein [Stenotrophobium sp.]
MNSKIFLSTAVLTLSVFAGNCWATAAGEVALITGRGTATASDGTVRSLAKGDSVYSGEIVNSGASSYVNLKFADGGFILLRPRSRFEIADFKYAAAAAPAALVAKSTAAAAPPVAARKPIANPVIVAPAAQENLAEHAFFRLLKGGFRAISGLVGHVNRADYRVSTPVATIGIRGTDYLAVICDAICAHDPVIAEVLPNGANALGGTVVGVFSGGIYIENAAGKQTDVAPGQYLINLPDGRQFVLPSMPHFLQVDPIPNPKDICAD